MNIFLWCTLWGTVLFAVCFFVYAIGTIGMVIVFGTKHTPTKKCLTLLWQIAVSILVLLAIKQILPFVVDGISFGSKSLLSKILGFWLVP